MSEETRVLPDGVVFLPIERLEDDRGYFAEMYRAGWFGSAPPVKQYQMLSSDPGVLRGFHVHAVHHDYLSCVSGEMRLGLKDMRPWAETYGMSTSLILREQQPGVIHIPPGVGHAFYFDCKAVLLLGVSHYWDKNDELTCRWNDPDLELGWQDIHDPILSDRDSSAGSYAMMQQQLMALIQ